VPDENENPFESDSVIIDTQRSGQGQNKASFQKYNIMIYL